MRTGYNIRLRPVRKKSDEYQPKRTPHTGYGVLLQRASAQRKRPCPSGPRERPAKPYSRGFKSRPALVSDSERGRRFGGGLARVKAKIVVRDSRDPLLQSPSPGPLAQLVRAPARHAGGHKFDSCTAHGNPSGSMEFSASPRTPRQLLARHSWSQAENRERRSENHGR